MPLKDNEKRKEYIKEWKRKKRKLEGKLGRGKYVRKELTEEERKKSKLKRLLYNREFQNKKYKNNPAYRMYVAAKCRAKKQGIPFDLEITDIFLPDICPYLKIPLVSRRERGDSRRDVYSLDRIDKSKGYVKGNVQVISWLANTMKSNTSNELLLTFAKNVLIKHKKICES